MYNVVHVKLRAPKESRHVTSWLCRFSSIAARLVLGRMGPECLWKVLFSDWISINTRQIMPVNSAKMHHLQQQWHWPRRDTATATGPAGLAACTSDSISDYCGPSQAVANSTPQPCPYWCFTQQRRREATVLVNNNVCSYEKLLCPSPLALSNIHGNRSKHQFLGLFPREAGASEVAVTSGLLVDGALQIQVSTTERVRK